MTTVSDVDFEQDVNKYLSSVGEQNEPLLIERKNQKFLLVAFDDLNSTYETLYLMKSEKNRSKLDKSIQQLKNGDVVTYDNLNDL